MSKRELPFDCRVIDTKPVEVANRFTGDKITIPPDAVAVYDSIMGAELFNDYDTMRKGLDWFIKHEPDAYMVLLDWTEVIDDASWRYERSHSWKRNGIC